LLVCFVHKSFWALLTKLAAMTEGDCLAYNAAWDMPEDNGYVTKEPMDINNVLDGTTGLDFSHAGGKFQHIMEEELHQQTRYVYYPKILSKIYGPNRRSCTDPQTRCDCTELRDEGFKHQLGAIVDAYITWQEALGEGGLEATPPPVQKELLQGTYQVQVINVFCKLIPLYLFLNS
jgi:hypothetical protein